jgi:hypothetical protein
MPKSPNCSYRFCGPNWETLHHQFWGQAEETPSQWFWGQTTNKSYTLVLRLNQETLTPCLHVHGADRTQRHLTSRSSGHQVPDQCDHPRSSAPGLLLLPRSSSLPTMTHLPPAHHETSKRDSPNGTKIKVKQTQCPRFEFKPCQVNDLSQSNQGIDHLISQFPPWWVHWQKSSKFEVRIQDPMKHS